MGYDLVLRSRRVVLPGGVRRGAVAVRQEKIAAIAGYDARLDAASDHDLGDLALLPGLVDTHVHVNEPGRTEWEGFESATRAAAAGGVTTICDMPLNSLPPTVTARALRVKRAAAAGKCAVNVAFWGGVVPGSLPELRGLHEAGVTGFKCFLADSGVPEFPPLDAAGLRAAMTEIRRAGSVLAVHAEDPGELGEASGTDYRSFLASRPPRAERRAIETVIEAAASTGARAHIVHLSAAGCLPMISAAKASGVALTAETCPHYLFFAAEEVPRGGTEFKCCPPIRDAANREALWRGLEAGVIDCVVSDHSPCPPALKRKESGDFGAAWGGIASLQLGLAAVWTAARRARADAGRRGAVDGRRSGRAGGPFRQGDDRCWLRRRPGRLRPGRRVHRARRRPGAPQPGHAVRGPRPGRGRPAGLAARPGDHPGFPPGRPAARPGRNRPASG